MPPSFCAAVWGYREKSAQLHELDTDPLGFARGDVEPGWLRSHGEVFERHKVPFSVGLAGTYKLHVRLRREAMPLPGSPFDLTVHTGPANGNASFLLSEISATKGRVVGTSLRTCDVMGNACMVSPPFDAGCWLLHGTSH